MSPIADDITLPPGRVLQSAYKALQKDLCDRCLGRLFARSGFGLTNQERGRSARCILALELESSGKIDTEIHSLIASRLPVHSTTEFPEEKEESVEPENGWHDPKTPSFRRPRQESDGQSNSCWVCEGLFEKVDELVGKVGEEAEKWSFETFLVGCRIDPQTVEREQILWQECDPPSPEPLKEEMNRSIGKRFGQRFPEKTHERSDPDIAFIVDPLYDSVKAQVKPIFIFGRYRKMVRGIPQTRWPCRTCRGKGCDQCGGTGRMYETSVEELVGTRPKELFRGEDFKLHGMGREDIDVLSLGSGRPFILEITKPKIREFDLDTIANEINASTDERVEVFDLRYSVRKEIPLIKEGSYKKSYRARISTEGDFNEETLKYYISLLAQSPIRQRTPTRVAHRRADKIRQRVVHKISAEVLQDGKAVVDLTTDGGLYIKELLHGDEGRTEPSLSSLLGRDIVVETLDVTGVHYPDDENGPKGEQSHG